MYIGRLRQYNGIWIWTLAAMSAYLAQLKYG